MIGARFAQAAGGMLCFVLYVRLITLSDVIPPGFPNRPLFAGGRGGGWRGEASGRGEGQRNATSALRYGYMENNTSAAGYTAIPHYARDGGGGTVHLGIPKFRTPQTRMSKAIYHCVGSYTSRSRNQLYHSSFAGP